MFAKIILNVISLVYEIQFCVNLESNMNTLGKLIPEFQAVYTGSRVSMYCNSITQPKWMKNGKLFRSLYIKGNGINFSHAKESDIGTYSCTGTTDSHGTPFLAHTQLYIGGKKVVFFPYISF